MDIIFMNSKNSKTSDSHRLLLSFKDKVNLKRSDKYIALSNLHCVKNVRIWSYSGLYSPALELNTVIYSVSLHIQSECGKMRTRITPNMDTFYAMLSNYYTRKNIKSHSEIKNLKYQLRHGMNNLNYLMDHILYQIFKITLNIS